MTAWIDHLLVSVRDLDAAETRWAAHGLAPNSGGQHAAGTANRLIRGPARLYLELIDAPAGVDDPIAAAVRQTEGPLSWAIGVDDLDDARVRLSSNGFPVGDIGEGLRTAPDGTRYSWRVCGPMGPLLHDWAPFLIEWQHPMPRGPTRAPSSAAWPSRPQSPNSCSRCSRSSDSQSPMTPTAPPVESATAKST